MVLPTPALSLSARLVTKVVVMVVMMGELVFPLPSHAVDVPNYSGAPVPTPTLSPGGSDSSECNEGLPPPDQPFRVVWNHPDNCERHGYPLHLDRYGFIFNRHRQFLGEEIQTLYRTGLWPTLSKTGDYKNGGLPQFFTERDYNSTWEALNHVTIDNFTGLAAIDFETWRAIYVTNFGKLKEYQQESVRQVKQRYPGLNQTMVDMVAECEWTEAAKSIMSTKLAIGQTLMPRGHWGYYGYPRRWGGDNNTVLQNNRLDWLWRQSTGLFPSIYINGRNTPRIDKVGRVLYHVREALRVQHEFSPPNTPIYPYSNLQSGTEIFYQKDHLEVTLRLPADMGAAGIVLWGSSSYYKNATRQCSRMQTHLRTVLGPFVRNLTQAMTNCSISLCGGNGRCVHNSYDHLLGEAESLRLSGLCTPRHSQLRDYHCRCYSSWEGACCQTPKPPRCQQQGSESPTREQSRNSTETSNTAILIG